MPFPIQFIIIGTICINLLSILLIILKGKQHNRAKWFLCITLFAVTWYLLIQLLIGTKRILLFPNLFNKGIPLYYLIAPCAYLYILEIVHGGQRKSRYDWIHFIPAALAVLDVLPFAFLPTADKLKIINLITQDARWAYSNKSGLIFSPAAHYVLRALQGVLYGCLQWYVLTKQKQRADHLAWYSFLTFSLILIVINLYTTIFNIQVILDFSHTQQLFSNVRIMGIGLILILSASVFIFFFPDSFRKKQAKPTLLSKDNNPEDFLGKQLEDFLKRTEIYKQQGLSISKIAVEMGVSAYAISNYLNQVKKQNFNAYINAWRVEYLIQRMEQGDLEKYTMETLIGEAGFSSRNTFYMAFKKQTGLTPSAYLNKKKDGRSDRLS